jgi:hypothetical protein
MLLRQQPKQPGLLKEFYKLCHKCQSYYLRNKAQEPAGIIYPFQLVTSLISVFSRFQPTGFVQRSRHGNLTQDSKKKKNCFKS